MSWHYLQGQEAESWEGTCLDGAPSALLKLMLTPEVCCSPGSATDCCQPFRSGTTCEPSTAIPGADGCRLSAADSLAPTFPQPGRVQELTAKPAAFGWKWPGSFAKFDRGSSSWRTRQCSLLGDLNEFSGTWPQWGLMRDGECLEQTALAPRTSATESGLWQTPVADDACNREKGKWNSRGEPKLSAQVKIYPEKWPTPRANDGEKRGNFDTENPRNGLPAAVKRYMTPTASIGTKCGGRHNGKADTLASQIAELEGMQQTSTGQLNPTWIEWLMGWPSGWTDCAALAMDRFQEWQRQHGCF